MSAKLHMSLDEIAKEERQKRTRTGRVVSRGRRGGGRGGRSSRSGPIRRIPGKTTRQSTTPFTREEFVEAKWGHDGYERQNFGLASKPSRVVFSSGQFGTKVHITDLRYDVLEEDLKELMEKVGSVESIKIEYDDSGRSLGKADVVFKTKADAEQAVREYDGAAIDDQQMKVEIVGRVRISGGWRSDSTPDNWRSTQTKNSYRPPIRNNNNNNNKKMVVDDEDLSKFRIQVSF